MKKLLSILMVAVFALSLTVPAFAANSSVKKKTNSEFGTLTGELYGTIEVGRKEMIYSTSTTKVASRLYASVDIVDYYTGALLDTDAQPVKYNATYNGYYWECHNASINAKKLSGFGAHEARGATSLVVYTTVTNI